MTSSSFYYTFHDLDKEKYLNKFEEETFLSIKENFSANPVLHAFQLTVNRFNIDEKHIKAFLDSMRMDLSMKKFNREEYKKYIYGSAEVVGLMCLKVFCNNEKTYNELEKYAISLSGDKLDEFLAQAEKKYKVGIENLVYKPGLSLSEFIDKDTISGIFELDVFKSMYNHIRKYFKNEKIIKLLEFPVLFLGATPKNTPALYSLMNYADIKLGTWYPEGGMYKVVEAMINLAKEKGVKFYSGEDVRKFSYVNKNISHVITSKKTFDVDYVVCSGDYHHFDQNILEEKYVLTSEASKYGHRKGYRYGMGEAFAVIKPSQSIT